MSEQAVQGGFPYRFCIAQARFKIAQGDSVGGLELLDEAEQLYTESVIPNVHPAAAIKTRLLIQQGRLTEATQWVRETGLAVDDKVTYAREFEYLTLVRVLIAQHRNNRGNNAIDQAIVLLTRLGMAAEAGGRRASVIEIRMLLALANEVQGDLPAARDSLQQALKLAESEGYIQLFVDEGPPMAQLLNAANVHRSTSDYLGDLLNAFDAMGWQHDDRSTHTQRSQSSTAQQEVRPLVEPLTPREQEVLALLVAGHSNPEIASELTIALTTVKTHVKNIYGKLEVVNRVQAVARAHSLDLA